MNDDKQQADVVLELQREIDLLNLEVLNEIAFVIDRICEAKGWNDEERSEAEWAALAHTEISEAFEEYRKGTMKLYFEPDPHSMRGKPEGMAIEYADALIRILHWFHQHNISAATAMRLKMEYNTLRPYRHGGKKA